jgi:uncharacterized protein (TIGR03437 family)
VNSAGVSTVVLTNLQSPSGLALDASGYLYFSETGGASVRRLGPDGTIISLGDGMWSAPQGISVDSSGDIFVADAGLQRIFEISASGQIFPIAGNGTAGFDGDGGDALSAELGYPSDVCTGPGGILYVADLQNNRIRQLAPVFTPAPAPSLFASAVSAATLQPGPVAPGMLIDVTGTGLGASDAPTTQVMFNAIPATILALDNTRLIVQAPAQLQGQQTAEIQILNQGTPLTQIPVGIAQTAPGLFTNSSGQAAASNADGSINSTANPSARGSVIALYGTGEGVTGLPASVTIGGYAAEVLYQGEVTGYPGLFQINVRVPAGYVPPGNLSVLVTIGQASTQPGVTVAIN